MAVGKTITVVVIDDNRILRDALATMLDNLPDMRAVAFADAAFADAAFADAAFADAAFTRVIAAKPDVILLDVGLRDDDSLRVALTLTREHPTAKIIVMDLFPVHEEIREFVNAGVAGFVLKDATFDEFVATIRSVAGGKKVLPPQMAESLFSQIAKAADGPDDARTLDDVRMTRREREVIELIGEGLSNKEIAKRLNIASHTVKSHVRNVMEKLALHSRLQIAAYSHRQDHP